MVLCYADHLDTPRAITSQAAQVVWRWDHAEPFGSYPANENPSGLGAFAFNLRLPGQYFDKETNLHYNYFRDYDPAIGRYVQADPIGVLTTGRPTATTTLNHLYAYVGGNPISLLDLLGLFALKSGVPGPSPLLTVLLDCIESCYGNSFVVTATTNDHPPRSPHGRGLAADIRYPADPSKFLCCASQCGAGFGQDEKVNPSAKSTAPHIHIQIPPGKGGGRGGLPPPNCRSGCP